MQQTENYINAMADYFDQSVATSSDDQLFAAGYLRGHIDLAVGTLQLQEQPFSVDTLQQQVTQLSEHRSSLARGQGLRIPGQRVAVVKDGRQGVVRWQAGQPSTVEKQVARARVVLRELLV